MKKLNKILIFAIAVAFLLNACVDLDETSFSAETTDTYFDNEDDIRIALVAVYNTMTKRYGGLDVFNTGRITMGTLGTHSGWYTDDIGRHNYLGGTLGTLERNYLGSYFGISKANLVLQKLDEKSGEEYLIPMTDEARNGYKAEARFIRGLYYFNLAQFFGSVPIVTTYFDGNLTAETVVGLSSIEEVYNYLVEDFKFAEEHLTDRNFGDLSQQGRATKGAAQGMLARVYMSMAGYPLNKGNDYYELAKVQALKVVDSGIYALQDDYTSLFYVSNENSNEWLFQVQFGPEEGLTGSWGFLQTVDGRFKGSGLRRGKNDGVGRLFPTEELVGAYDESDPRFIYNIITTDIKGKPNKKTHKFKTTKFRHLEDFLGRNKTGMNAPILRYADILLMLAEAENELNGPADAYQYINDVRARARRGSVLNEIPVSTEPADISGLTQEEFRESVFWERTRELCWEGVDRIDLVRSGNFVNLINDATYVGKESSVTEVTEEHIFFPLPLLVILNNDKIN